MFYPTMKIPYVLVDADELANNSICFLTYARLDSLRGIKYTTLWFFQTLIFLEN